jgi:3-oxoadipate enol-lactonase
VRASLLRLADGGRLSYRREGRPGGVPILLLRPLGGSMILWDDLVAGLLATHELIRFDPRGVGDSSHAHVPLCTRAMARDARALLDGLGVPRADVFGLSLGGLVAQWLVADAPARVHRLALGSTPWGKRRLAAKTFVELAELMAQLLRREPEVALVRHVLSPRFRHAQPARVRAIEAAVRRHPADRGTLARFALAAALHDAPVPGGNTLWLYGEDDPLLRTSDPGRREEVLPGAGHDLSLEAPAALARRLASHFAPAAA